MIKVECLYCFCIQIPKEWNNPSGEYHIGLKNAEDLYPRSSKVKERVLKKKKVKHWDPVHKGLVADAVRDVQVRVPLLGGGRPRSEERSHCMSGLCLCSFLPCIFWRVASYLQKMVLLPLGLEDVEDCK